ncbi:hypothetical protein V3C99_006317, partial [Haemonchus contortus]|uniref:Secreted protein n=1 Tax=Haemonchus contortus TaxID=6289 RepID=A0A7I4XSL8_HAECO
VAFTRPLISSRTLEELLVLILAVIDIDINDFLRSSCLPLAIIRSLAECRAASNSCSRRCPVQRLWALSHNALQSCDFAYAASGRCSCQNHCSTIGSYASRRDSRRDS